MHSVVQRSIQVKKTFSITMFINGILTVLCVFCVNVSVGHQVSQWLESPKLTNWGDWGLPALCPENKWVVGLNLKIEGSQGQRFLRNDDDTALNAVHLTCADFNGNGAEPIWSTDGEWGSYRGDRRCVNGIATGFQLRSEPDQRGKDDVGAVDMALRCTNFNGDNEIVVGGGVLDFGHWTDLRICPPMTAVCGIQTQVEPPQGRGDDTSLNNVNIACCRLPQPEVGCKNPQTEWVTILHCQGGLKCSTTFITGLSTTKQTSHTLSESSKFYQELGFNVGAEYNAGVIKANLQLNGKFGREFVNGKSVTQIIGETSTYQQEVHIEVNCAGALQGLQITCGNHVLKTSTYRCF